MGKQVLIVNYEPKSLARLNQIVMNLGLETVTARNGQEALDIIASSKLDLVIIDPMLPKVSGFEVAQQLHDAHKDIPIIMVTSVYKGNRYRTEAMTKYGVSEYVEEPFQEDQFRGLIRKHLDMAQPKPPKPKKASTKRRLEEILEETITGSMPSGTGVTRPAKKKPDEPVLTSEEIFSDVIADVEAAPVESKDSVEAAVEEKLEQTLSGLKVPSRKKKRKGEAAGEDARPGGKPEDAKTAPAEMKKEEGTREKQPRVERKDVEVASSAPKVEKPATKKKPASSEGIEYGSYVLLEKVATGGMAELFKAKRRGVQGFQKIVAIKRILSHLVDNEEFVTMFIDEAKLAAQLNHPNIAQIYDLGKIENSFYIAMEYVEGYDLRNILKECRKKKVKIPESLVLFVAGKVLSALDYAHRKKGLDMKDLKIVHRDISPQNILISKGGDVKLVDFGIAKAATKASQTQAGALKGKLLYMSPEQAYGKQIDRRSDLFSLGSVMYEALTGMKCFLADSEISILEKVRKVQYKPIRKVDSSISIDTEMIISKALARNIDERFQSAKEMESEIHDYMESLPFAISERVLARFVNALYEGDMATIEEIESKYKTVKGASERGPVQEVTDPGATVRMESAPVAEGVKPAAKAEATEQQEQEDEISVSEEDLAPAASRVNETGTVIMPDLEEVEREEEEMLEHFDSGASGSRTGLMVAVVVVVAVIAAFGYYWWKHNQTVPAPVQKTTQMLPTPAQTKDQGTESQPQGAEPMASQEPPSAVGSTASTPTGVTSTEASNAGSTQETDATLNIDREKLVQELLKKKLAEQEALLKQKESKRSPVVVPVSTQSSRQAQLKSEKAPTETKPTVKPQKKETAVVSQPSQGQGAVTAPKTTTREAVKKSAGEAVGKTEASVTQPETPVKSKPAVPQTEQPTESTPETSASKPASEPVTKSQPPVTQPEKSVESKPSPAPRPTVPQVKEGDLVPLVEGEVIFPKVIKEVKPSYTALARKLRTHGTILAQALVDENGDVIETRILRNIPGRHGLDKEVMRALKKWKFTPAIKQGVRVKVYYTQAFQF